MLRYGFKGSTFSKQLVSLSATATSLALTAQTMTRPSLLNEFDALWRDMNQFLIRETGDVRVPPPRRASPRPPPYTNLPPSRPPSYTPRQLPATTPIPSPPYSFLPPTPPPSYHSETPPPAYDSLFPPPPRATRVVNHNDSLDPPRFSLPAPRGGREHPPRRQKANRRSRQAEPNQRANEEPQQAVGRQQRPADQVAPPTLVSCICQPVRALVQCFTKRK